MCMCPPEGEVYMLHGGNRVTKSPIDAYSDAVTDAVLHLLHVMGLASP